MSAPSPPPSPLRRQKQSPSTTSLASSTATVSATSASASSSSRPLPPPPPPPRRGSRQTQHGPPTPARAPLNEASRADASKLQIRVVPYSPPRLSSDGSASSRPVSYADSDTVALTSASISPSIFAASPTVRRASARQGPEDGQTRADVSDAIAAANYDDEDQGAWLTPNVQVHASSSSNSPAHRGALPSARSGGMTPGDDPGFAVNASPPAVISTDRPSSAASSIGSRSSNRSRRNRTINLHANNKTFSLAPLSGSLSSRTTGSSYTAPLSLSTTRSSYGRVSSASAVYTDDRPISPLTSMGDQPGDYTRSAESPASTLPSIPDITTASPWNYRLVGGLRKVSNAPVDEHHPETEPGPSRVSSNSSSQESLPSLPPLAAGRTPSSSQRHVSASLAPKASFQSSDSYQSDSTVSDRTNYKVYGQSSPAVAAAHHTAELDSLPPTSSHSNVNFRVIGQSSPAGTFRPQTADDVDTIPPSSSHSNVNYRVIGQSSPVVAARHRATVRKGLLPSSSQSNANFQIIGESSSSNNSLYEPQRPQTGESDVNYIVHHPGASTSSLGTTRSRLRPEYSQESLIVPPLRPGRQSSIESLRLAAKRSRDSLRSASFTSLSSIITQEAARALFAGPASIYIQPTIRKEHSRGSVAASGGPGRLSMIASHPHQWSSQLSTVPSESEPSSRSLSPISEANRRSSYFSHQSARMRSISSSLAGPADNLSRSASHSFPESIDRPQAAHFRHGSREESLSPRLIRDHDEDGDGLADLEDLRHKHSRGRLSNLLSPQSSDRNLRSSGSSRSNSLTSSLPAWARYVANACEQISCIDQQLLTSTQALLR